MRLRFTLFIFLLSLFYAPTISAQFSLNVDFVFEGNMRSCKLYVPATYSAGTEAPLVISLHGFGGTGGEQKAYDELSLVADTAGFILAYPTAYNNVWNAGEDYYGPYTSEDDVTYISQLIDSIGAVVNIDPTRVYACGMSNGGDMAYRLACELSDRLAAVASVTGTMITDIYESCAPLNQMPIVHFHGTNDFISNINGGPGWVSLQETIALWSEINGCGSFTGGVLPNTDTEDGCRIKKYNKTCLDAVDYTLFLTKNGGHTWPGSFYSDLTVYYYGLTNGDINASVELWKFFLGYTREDAPLIERSSHGLSGSESDVVIWPQPAHDYLNIHVQNTLSATGKLYVYAMNGQLILSSVVGNSSENIQLNLSTLTVGNYILQWQVGTQSGYTSFIKQ